jgi:hypothetical protein
MLKAFLYAMRNLYPYGSEGMPKEQHNDLIRVFCVGFAHGLDSVNCLPEPCDTVLLAELYTDRLDYSKWQW